MILSKYLQKQLTAENRLLYSLPILCTFRRINVKNINVIRMTYSEDEKE